MSNKSIDGKKKNFKQKLKEEFIEYWINVLYLFVYFGVFVTYKRLILANYEIQYEEYGIAFINAFILGKVVSIGGMMNLGNKMNERPLIFSILFKTILFTIWLALFNVLEVMVTGYFKTRTLDGTTEYFSHHFGTYEYYGGLLIVFTCFIPFFAIKEFARVLGIQKVKDLFFKNKESV